MMRTWKMIGLRTLLAALLTAAPAAAQNTSEMLDDMHRQLSELKKTLEGVRDSLGTLSTIRKDVEDLTTQSNLRGQTMQGQIADLQRQLIQLRSDLEGLRDRVGSGTRTSLFPPTESASATAGTARVEMVNTYPQEVTITVNRTAYHVPPGQTRLSDPIPAGRFTYEVLGVSPAPLTRTLAANRVFTVHVHPQP